MKRSDFTKHASGKVIKTRQGYLVFVPAPLPPDLNWSDQLLKTLSIADRSRKTLQMLLDSLISSPITSISQVQENLPIPSFNTAQRNMDKLEALGIVREVTGGKRNRLYQADEILRILEERISS